MPRITRFTSTFLLLSLLAFLATGCTLMGYGIGDIMDTVSAPEQKLTDTETLKQGEVLVLHWKDGTQSIGKVTSTVRSDSIRILYYSNGYKIDTSLNELTELNTLDRIELKKKSRSGRVAGTTMGALMDLTFLLLFLLLRDASFAP